ncbi:MAG TPA: hypothetical protein DEA22_12425 [Blastocatellia bacterium]|nr:hypothetical protein [Blastocatellia bacterium]
MGDPLSIVPKYLIARPNCSEAKAASPFFKADASFNAFDGFLLMLFRFLCLIEPEVRNFPLLKPLSGRPQRALNQRPD